MTEIDAIALLAPAEGMALLARLKRATPAQDLLVRRTYGCIHLARRFARPGVLLEDLIAEGNVGLLRAAEGFDPTVGTRFATYAAYWVRQSMRRASQRDVMAVRLPQYLWTMLGKWRRTAYELERELGRIAEEGEIATRLQLRPKKLKAIRKAMKALTSAQLSDESGGPGPVNRAADDRETGPEESLDSEEQLRRAVAALYWLPDREATILRLRFGLDGARPATLKEVSEQLGYTRERIRQIEKAALAKLRERLYH